MPDEPAPPRKTYGFKPREFERANPPRPSSDTAPVAPDPGITVHDGAKIDVNDLVRAGAGAGRQLGSNATANRTNEIHALLRDNHARASAAGLNNVALPAKRKSKRRRDFLFLLGSGNLVLTLAFVVQRIFAGAGLVLFNVGLIWIMWFVMDDY